MQRHPSVRKVKFRFRINGLHLFERALKYSAELADLSVAVTELLVQPGPGNAHPALGLVHSMQTLSKPGVNIERHGVMRQARDGCLIEWHRMLHQAFKIS